MNTPDHLDAHCRKPGCSCSHRGCYRGWRDSDTETRPCPDCRSELYERWLRANEARQKGYPYESVQRILTKVGRNA